MNFRSNEISAKQNFVAVDAKFRLDDSEMSFDLTKIVAKFHQIFARIKNEKHQISFAFLLHSTVDFHFLNAHKNAARVNLFFAN